MPRHLTVNDEGSGNGLDADTVDGSHASAFATASHNHAASEITSGTLAHERGGLEADVSAIAEGGLIVGTGTGSMGLLAVGAEDEVLTVQSDGSLDWEAPAGGTVESFEVYESASTSLQLVSSITPTNGNVSVTVSKPAGATTGKVMVSAFVSTYGAANNTLLRMAIGDGSLDYNEGRTSQSSSLWGSNGTVIGKTISASTTYTLRLWKNSGSQNANVSYQRIVAMVIWS